MKWYINLIEVWILLIGLLMISCNEEQVPEEDSVPKAYMTETVVYDQEAGIDMNLLSLDVYHGGVQEDLRPVLIYVHGGGWVIGDKSNNLENKQRLARDLDYILVSVNYRLSPFPIELDNPDRIQFPAYNVDVAKAVRWVYDNIAQYGGDRSKLGLMGHSAGAQIVSLMGTNEQFLRDEGLMLSDLSYVISVDTRGYDIAKQLVVGTNPDLYENAFTTDPQLNKEASALEHVDAAKNIPSFFVAKRGTTERISDADEFIDKLRAANVDVTDIDGSVYDHEGINTAIGEEDEIIITKPIKDFLISIFPN